MTDSVQARAIATFKSQYGLMRIGQIGTYERSYAEEMVIKKNIEIIPTNPEPDRRQAFTRAPHTAGKGHATEAPPRLSPSPDSADALASGAENPASSSPQVRRSKRKTLITRGAKPG